MSHGYFMKRGGEVVLGFANTAANFQGEQPLTLIPAKDGEEVLAYSVVREGENRGFLWHVCDKHRAEVEAVQFTAIFGRRYNCVSLTHDQPQPVDR